jgi:hypothetical protein
MTYSMKYNIICTRQTTRKAEAHCSWLPMTNIIIENKNATQAEWTVKENKSNAGKHNVQ